MLGWVEDSALRSHSRGFGVADHSRGALLLGLFGDGWAPFFVTNSLVQDQPDQPALSMGNGPDGLVVSSARGHLSCSFGGLLIHSDPFALIHFRFFCLR